MPVVRQPAMRRTASVGPCFLRIALEMAPAWAPPSPTMFRSSSLLTVVGLIGLTLVSLLVVLLP